MFCSTVRRESALVSWNVRTTPSRATWYGLSLPSGRPLNDQVPVFGWSKPVSRLNSVVLPAPFGPISPVMPPRWISRWSTDTAVSPPKVRATPSTTIAGSGLATPTSQGTSRSATCASRCGASPWRNAGRSPDAPAAEAPCGVGSAGIEHHLSSVPENALGPEHQQQHEPEAHEDEADLGHVRGGEQALGNDAVADQGPQSGVGELQDEQHHHGPDDGAEHPCGAAQDERRVGEERVGVLVLVGDRRAGADGVDHAADRTDHAAEDQRLHLVEVDVLPERPDGVLVLPDRIDAAAPGPRNHPP